MASLEQIRALEARVEKAVGLIGKLRKENAELEERLMEASRSEEQTKSAFSELERKAAVSARNAAEAAGQVDELLESAQEAEEKTKNAELRAAEAEERAATLERKAQASESEIAAYRERALAAEHKVAELESRVEDMKREQSRIEEGLVHALGKLDAFEDLVMGISTPAGETAPVEYESGDGKVGEADESRSAEPSQGATFRGTENELDIF